MQPTHRSTDPVAVASLVLGILGGTLGLPLGAYALMRIRRSGDAGKGLAIGGIVASLVWLLAIGALVLLSSL